MPTNKKKNVNKNKRQKGILLKEPIMDYYPQKNDQRVQLLIWLTKAPFLLIIWIVKKIRITSNKTSNKTAQKTGLLKNKDFERY